jgi:conjugal transfer mating pair stabilization protein TraN
MKILPLLWGCLFTVSVFAGLEESYEAGKSFATGLQDQAKTGAVQEVAGFTSNLAATEHLQQYMEEDGKLNLLSSATKQAEKGETFAVIDDTNKEIVIDPSTDPLFAHEKMSNEQPLGLHVVVKDLQKYPPHEIYCEEAGSDANYTCLENLQINLRLREDTVLGNHLNFTERRKTLPCRTCGNIPCNIGKRLQSIVYGYEINLPENIEEFKLMFCPNFKPIDAVTNLPLNINCNSIKGFTIDSVNDVTVNKSNGNVQVLLPKQSLIIKLQHNTYEGETTDTWYGCDAYESLLDNGNCEYVSKEISQGPDVRHIDGQAISKSVWQYKNTYSCKAEKNECQALRLRGCAQINSECKEWRGDICWVYKQKYQCPNSQVEQTRYIIPGAEAFCLSGDCASMTYTANQDMLEAISKLNVLQEIHKSLPSGISNPSIFTGQVGQCSRSCVNFKDCCRRKGWGVSMGLAECSSEERELGLRREQGLCHMVGTYCAKKVLGKCIKKKTSFCCFPSKLARILHEQGRPQLGLGWGDSKDPSCHGLQIDQIAKLNMDVINFSELFTDIMQKYRAPNELEKKQQFSDTILEEKRKFEDKRKFNETIKEKMNNIVIGMKKNDK